MSSKINQRYIGMGHLMVEANEIMEIFQSEILESIINAPKFVLIWIILQDPLS